VPGWYRHAHLALRMNIQQCPESLQSFAWAVVRLATYVANEAPQPRLLFGSVTLLTEDRPRPAGGQGVDQINVGRPRAGRAFFRRTVLSAGDAIAWYRSDASGVLLTPEPTNPDEIVRKLDGQLIAAPEFFDDPEWPALGVPTGPDQLFIRGGPGDPAPFVGSGSSPARIHRRFGDDTGFVAVTGDPEVVAFLKHRLHVDLRNYSEYFGSLVLVVPDPILRRIDHFVVPSDDPRSESLVFRLVPRAGQGVDPSVTLRNDPRAARWSLDYTGRVARRCQRLRRHASSARRASAPTATSLHSKDQCLNGNCGAARSRRSSENGIASGDQRRLRSA
jgi:hypothetical protein